MEIPLIAKLRSGCLIEEGDALALLGLCWDTRTVAARRDIIGDGCKPDRIHLLLEGWAARYKLLPDGSRQIMAFLLPGDFCDLHASMLDAMDHGIMALTSVRVAFIRHEVIEHVMVQRPNIAHAFRWSTLVDEGMLRAWIVNIGRRRAHNRVAHLLCELSMRLKVIGFALEGEMPFPLTQDEIADALGLTSMHVNRVLRQLRADGHILLKRGRLTICNHEALRQIASYDANYMHCQPPERSARGEAMHFALSA